MDHAEAIDRETLPTLDLLAPENLYNPYPMFRRFLDEAPVHWDAKAQVWVISKYDDIHRLLRDKRLSSDRYRALANSVPPDQRDMNEVIVSCLSKFLLNVEGAAHQRLRSLSNKAFTKKSVVSLRSGVEEVVNSLLDRVQSKGRMDIVSDLAYPLPTTFICRILGVPLDQTGPMKQLSDDISVYIGSAGKATGCIPLAYESLLRLQDYFRDLVRQRACEPREDMITDLIEAEIDGDRLSEEEVVANCILLLVSGFETTTNLIASGTFALLENPAQMDMLRGKPTLIDGAIEEFLRYYPPVNRTARVALDDIPVRDHLVKKGDIAIFLLGAGNRDPDAFTHPDRLDIQRNQNPCLSFGGGIHFCIGAYLAKLEGSVAINTLLRRMPGLRMAENGIEWRGNSRFRGLKSLRVAY